MRDISDAEYLKICEYVDEAYLKVLGRRADENGKNSYAQQIIKSQITREDLVRILRDSDEYKCKQQLGVEGIPQASLDPPSILKVLQSFEGNIAYDVGANVGAAGQILSRKFEAVYSFEPATESFEHLKKKSMVNNRIHPFNIAISDTDQGVELLVVKDSISQGQLTSSAPEAWGPKIGSRRVASRKLDTFIRDNPTPDFVKIDTGFHELRVMEGAQNLITNYGPAFFIEIHDETSGRHIQEILTREQYLIQVHRHPEYPRETGDFKNHYWLVAKRLSPNRSSNVTRE